MRETLYSENGSTPRGERTTTHYSSDPKDFDSNKKSPTEIREKLFDRENSRNKNIKSVTRTEVISGSGGEIESDDYEETTRKTVVRRGSVKELSEKFIQKESSSTITSNQSSYPKAGLIYRAQSQSSRASTPGDSVDFDSNDIEVKKTSRSFLNSGSKVTGVQDVLERMRNADHVEETGDTEEDREARALLNKFLGATVLMKGMEGMLPEQITTTRVTTSSPRQQQVSRI